jgi:hypothetical protein
MPIESTVKGPILLLTTDQKKQIKEKVQKTGLLNVAVEK